MTTTMEAGRRRSGKVDYSSVTPATGIHHDNKPIADSFANQMPTADFPGEDDSPRMHPDKTIPGPEAAAGIDEAVQDRIEKNTKDRM